MFRVVFGLYPHSFGINATYFLYVVLSVGFITKLLYASDECVTLITKHYATIQNSITYIIQSKLEVCVGYK